LLYFSETRLIRKRFHKNIRICDNLIQKFNISCNDRSASLKTKGAVVS